MQDLPFSAASERNQEPILTALRGWILPGQTVLEIGSGTGQHAVYFTAGLEGVRWIPTEVPGAVELSAQRIRRADLPGLETPRPLDVTSDDWHELRVDAVFSANTAHIMSWREVEAMFDGVGNVLGSGHFFLYGPFNRDGVFTSDGNAAFHRSLQTRDSRMGIRDDQALISLGVKSGLDLVADLPMPANNRLLIWQRSESPRDSA